MFSLVVLSLAASLLLDLDQFDLDSAQPMGALALLPDGRGHKVLVALGLARATRVGVDDFNRSAVDAGHGRRQPPLRAKKGSMQRSWLQRMGLHKEIELPDGNKQGARHCSNRFEYI